SSPAGVRTREQGTNTPLAPPPTAPTARAHPPGASTRPARPHCAQTRAAAGPPPRPRPPRHPAQPSRGHNSPPPHPLARRQLAGGLTEPLDLVGQARLVGAQAQRPRDGVERARRVAQVALAALGDGLEQGRLLRRRVTTDDAEAHLEQLHHLLPVLIALVERL